VLLGDLLPLHFAGKLARDHSLDGGGGDLLADSSFTEPALET
jgi:hypothetical protein